MTQFFTLSPSVLPPIDVLMDNFLNGVRSPKLIAKHLGVSTSTLKRWLKTENVPRTALLAIFWETKYGYSILNTHLHNELQLTKGLVQALKCEIDQLRVRINYLETVGHFGCANSPMYTPVPSPSRPTVSQMKLIEMERKAS